MWVGMDFEGGINRLKDERRNLFTKPAELLNAPVRVIHEDRRGALWIGTGKGLNVVHNGKCRTYTRAQGLGGNLVMVIHEDSTGGIWVGTDGGLSRWQGGKFKTFTTQEGLSHNAVGAIYEDADQTLWIGTKGGGLNRFQGGRFTPYTTRQGLFSDEVYEILEDDSGNFWMSCRTGIFRVPKRQFSELDRGQLKSLTCTAFGKADGLASVQCNGVAKPAGWKDSRGSLWFPTIRGVAAIESRIKTNERPPPVSVLRR
jgi:ligand-binding sensor domain-containing protein